jgi:anti-sigma factor RsiW
MTTSTVTESDLHAYVDDELVPAKRVIVEVYLQNHPDDAKRVRQWQAQKFLLKERYLSSYSEPPSSDDKRKKSRWALMPQQYAAALLLALGCGVLGWLGRGAIDTSTQITPELAATNTFAYQVALAHATYSPEFVPPSNLAQTGEEQSVTWLKGRMGKSISPPTLKAQGYQLIGGRWLTDSRQLVAQFMYHDVQGRRLTLYVADRSSVSQSSNFRTVREGVVNVVYWSDSGGNYALSSAVGNDELLTLAKSIKQQKHGKKRVI